MRSRPEGEGEGKGKMNGGNKSKRAFFYYR